MGLLGTIEGPADLRGLDQEQLRVLAEEVRGFLVDAVCHTGGHLGPNLGVVELTIALHRVFDSPGTPVVFDTGHQSYVHKILTGRQGGFAKLRAAGGLSGYPNRAESVHDLVENSHASTALSYADGLSRARTVTGEGERPVVAVIGDGALTGGLAWEALNNIGASRRRVIVVLNDNGRSYSPTVGGLPRHLRRISDRPTYAELWRRLGGAHGDGSGVEARDDASRSLFADLGFDYLGPVDGHDISALERQLFRAGEHTGPVIVHVRTTKGRGYRPAEDDVSDHMHTVGVIDPQTGATAGPTSTTWTDVFADNLVEIGASRRDVVAVTAAMLGPTGLQRFADRYPGRCVDVGIAEQHAVTSAAGMAMGGLHPVVALYATFANRAFDQELLDVGLHRLPVTLVLDRAGVTGPDGPSHHGMWDLALLGIVPGIRVAAPRDAGTLAEELGEAVDVAGPTALRFPKAKLGAPVPAVRRSAGLDVLREADPTDAGDVLLVSVGALAPDVLGAADMLAAEGVDCTVVDPRWVLPIGDALVDLAAAHRLVVTVEDGIRDSGVGSRLARRVSDAGAETPVVCLGLDTTYLAHGTRADLLREQGLDASGIAAAVLARRDADSEPVGALSGAARPLAVVPRTRTASG
ncbi:MAG TPA: 1-deoxy-D-xylulose-5-phosphate synthase [Nocardioidaceae bacterium]|nr:1-deoxy-D-xylulose-5-phosphate synthase [Nocardioidaceae bacterium]